jgi:hypothetical protein
MFCASVAYPLESEGFDFDYFRDHYAPMFAEMLGENCVRFEVHRGLASPALRSHRSLQRPTSGLRRQKRSARRWPRMPRLSMATSLTPASSRLGRGDRLTNTTLETASGSSCGHRNLAPMRPVIVLLPVDGGLSC